MSKCPWYLLSSFHFDSPSKTRRKKRIYSIIWFCYLFLIQMYFSSKMIFRMFWTKNFYWATIFLYDFFGREQFCQPKQNKSTQFLFNTKLFWSNIILFLYTFWLDLYVSTKIHQKQKDVMDSGWLVDVQCHTIHHLSPRLI